MAKARLSNTYEALSGRLGNTSLANFQDGVEVRAYNPISRQPFTASQVAVETAFTIANQAWTGLDRTTADAWRAWGRTQKVRNPLSGKDRVRAGKDCFVGLYAKLLQMDPTASAPDVPVGAFTGDPLAITVAAGSGTATWTAAGANAPGVTTEFLAQSLPSAVALAAPDGYHTLGFHAFNTLVHTYGTDLAPGFWAFGVRFVETATGRATAVRPLGTGTVGLAVVRGGRDEGKKALRAA